MNRTVRVSKKPRKGNEFWRKMPYLLLKQKVK
jgi:hypothetical protein